VSNWYEIWAHKTEGEKFSRFPDTVIVAIVSNDVTLARENLGYEGS
jgi:hypothetical protein